MSSQTSIEEKPEIPALEYSPGIVLPRQSWRKGWWRNFSFILASLVMRDFRVRYRNMSLGVLWSLANPLIMMLVLTFVFVHVFPNSTVKNYPVFVLAGLAPFNFFALAWATGTASLQSNAGLVRRVRMQRELLPISTVLAQSIHFFIQMVLVLAFAIAWRLPITGHWVWILPISLVELLGACGIALMCSALDVYFRDTRYIVDSATTVLFWLSPVFYPVEFIPQRFRIFYEMNPVSATIICLRQVLLNGMAPDTMTFERGLVASIVLLVLGFGVFRALKGNFGDYL
jgi:homopolymeric O-antigen transport system permease protein